MQDVSSRQQDRSLGIMSDRTETVIGIISGLLLLGAVALGIMDHIGH
jgi:hypothetical protein